MLVPVPPWQDDQPRRHHYEFAHRALPAIALSPRADLAALARADRLDDALRATWASVGERHSEPDRVPDTGLHGELAAVGDHPSVLITFPLARHAAEAFFAIITLDPPDHRRYITLEFSWDVMTGEPTTVIGEWRSGSHYNLGQGPQAAAAAFLARVTEFFGGRQGR